MRTSATSVAVGQEDQTNNMIAKEQDESAMKKAAEILEVCARDHIQFSNICTRP